MLAQRSRSPSAGGELADLGLVGEVGGIEGSMAVGETGSSDVLLRPFTLEWGEAMDQERKWSSINHGTVSHF